MHGLLEDTMQKIKCWECGKEATCTRNIFVYGSCRIVSSVSPYTRCYCEECAQKVEELEKTERAQYVKLKKREMFRKACDVLEKQNTNMYEYKDAIEVVRDKIEESPDKFDSSYEVLAAIVLVQNRIYSKMQYKIEPYQVDFLLPELFVVLEVDGERHKHKKEHDTRRDIYIQNALGEGWDIIRISTDYLDRDAKKLPEAIHKVIDYRQTGKVNWRKLYK